MSFQSNGFQNTIFFCFLDVLMWWTLYFQITNRITTSSLIYIKSQMQILLLKERALGLLRLSAFSLAVTMAWRCGSPIWSGISRMKNISLKWRCLSASTCTVPPSTSRWKTRSTSTGSLWMISKCVTTGFPWTWVAVPGASLGRERGEGESSMC